MKKVVLLCAGKIKEKYFTDGIAEYTKRLSKYCEFKIAEVADFSDDDKSIEKESALFLKELNKFTNAKIVLFDIGGENVSSQNFSSLLDKSYTDGKSAVVFIIGGSKGVSDEIKKIADVKISFGKITYPHQLMRLIATEQIYRGFTILDGTPYHK